MESYNVQNSYTEVKPVSQKLSAVYTKMFGGLAVTSVASFLTLNSGLLEVLGGSVFILLLIEIGLVWFISARIETMSIPAMYASFYIYSILNGITLSVVVAAYTSESVFIAFSSTAVIFAAMSIIGKTTKKDLAPMGSFMYMGLIGMVFAIVINLFVGSSALSTTISILMVIIFSGLTAWETQEMKLALAEVDSDDTEKRLTTFFALSLYLNFINIFLSLLRLFGDRD